MITAFDIVHVIQQIPADNRKIKFFVSLANNWFKFGRLTEAQELAFKKAIEELREDGFL